MPSMPDEGCEPHGKVQCRTVDDTRVEDQTIRIQTIWFDTDGDGKTNKVIVVTTVLDGNGDIVSSEVTILIDTDEDGDIDVIQKVNTGKPPKFSQRIASAVDTTPIII